MTEVHDQDWSSFDTGGKRFTISELSSMLDEPIDSILSFAATLDPDNQALDASTVPTNDQVFEITQKFDKRPFSLWPPRIAPFGALLQSFVDGGLGAAEFQSIYIRLYKTDDGPIDRDLQGILQTIFLDADEYVRDPWLRVGDFLDDASLLERTTANLEALKSLLEVH